MTFTTKTLATVALALLSFAGNMLNLPLFFGLHFIFGSVAVMLAVKLLGTWPALWVALAGGTYTWLLWGHPYALLTFTLEAFVVSLLYRRGVQNLVLADLAFWLVAGPSLIPLFYAGAIGMDTSSASMIGLKQALNGLFNALIAGILIKAMVWRFQTGSVDWLPSNIRLNELLFHVVLTLTLVAGATPVIIGSHTDKTEQEQALAGQLERVLNATAESLQRQSGVSTTYKNQLLRYSLTPEVAGIALLDNQGQVIAQAGEFSDSSTGNVKPLSRVDNLGIWLPDYGESLVKRWKSGAYQYRLPLPDLPNGAELLAERSARPLIQAVEDQRNESFALLAGMTLLSILASFLLSRVLTRPLSKLDRASQYLPEKIRRQQALNLPESMVQEYSVLSASLRTMSKSLAQTFSELDNSRANLELEVQARTRELANTSTMLSNVLEASTELAIIATDTEGTITLFNTGAENLLGYDSSEVVSIQNPGLFHLSSEMQERARELSVELGEPVSGFDIFVKNPARQGSETREWSYVTKQGSSIPVMLTVTPIRDDSGELVGFLGIAQDITERKRVEQMKNEFISTVSHELRTPLTSVNGALGLVLGGKSGDLPGKAVTLLNTAHRNTERLAHLINDLLDMEKIEAGKVDFDMQVQRLQPILEQAVEENKAYGAERGVRLVLASTLNGEKARIDEQRLKQVLANLLSNAMKFSPDNGTVTLDATSTDSDITVSITDQGPGIPKEFHNQIFQKFAQADSSDTRQKGGTGLGLAITRELVQRMGGAIDFETGNEQGTRFFFTLPSIRTSETPSGLLDCHSGNPAPASPRILVVEDDPDVAELLKIMMEGAGYQVSICHTGSEGLEAVKTGAYDLISLDLMLPDLSGLDVIRQLKQKADTANIPIMVVSAKVELGRLELNGEVDNIAWLPKPIDHQKLIDLVKRQLPDGGRPKILHVEDDADLHDVVSAMVKEELTLDRAGTIARAKALLAQNTYDAVLLDIGLPDGSGWTLIPDIEREQPDAAIVILSGQDVSKEKHAIVEGVLLKNRLTGEQLVNLVRRRIEQSLPPVSGVSGSWDRR